MVARIYEITLIRERLTRDDCSMLRRCSSYRLPHRGGAT